MVGIAFTGSIAVSRVAGDPIRNAWPMAEIAEEARTAWNTRSHTKLQIVSGANWLAGLVSIGSPERPHVIFDGVLARSSWLNEDDLRKHGVLYVWFTKNPPEGLIQKGVTIDMIGTFDVTGLPERYRTIGYAVRLPAAR